MPALHGSNAQRVSLTSWHSDFNGWGSTRQAVPGSSTLTGKTANQYLLQEAYRPVIVREGEQTIELPAIQAVFRAMGVSAMKGNRFAQRTIAELVQSVEAEDRKLRLENAETMINYKCEWEKAIERARELGQPEPQPIPHPDDVIIDFRSGDARVCGPMTKEEKTSWDRLLEYRDELQSEVSHYASAYRKSRHPDKKARSLELWLLEQRLYKPDQRQLSEALPQRFAGSVLASWRLKGRPAA